MKQSLTFQLVLAICATTLGAALLGIAGCRTEATILVSTALIATITIAYIAIFHPTPSGPTP